MRKKITEQENPEPKTGTLYLVSTPIGNDDDITLRALKVLKSVDIVVCEEAKVGARTLHKYNLTQKMELLNEQNESQQTDELMTMLLSGKSLGLISDCGTPVFADPGLELVQRAIAKNVEITVIPGPSSIMTAIVRSGFSLDQFVFAGFLSRSKDQRVHQLKNLLQEAKTVVLFETPYRLITLLNAASQIMPKRRAYIGCNLTFPFETHHYGTIEELYHKFEETKFKGEFVIVLEGATLEEVKAPLPEVRFMDEYEEDDDFGFNKKGVKLEGAYYTSEELMELNSGQRITRSKDKSFKPSKPGFSKGSSGFKKGGSYGKPSGSYGKPSGSYGKSSDSYGSKSSDSYGRKSSGSYGRPSGSSSYSKSSGEDNFNKSDRPNSNYKRSDDSNYKRSDDSNYRRSDDSNYRRSDDNNFKRSDDRNFRSGKSGNYPNKGTGFKKRSSGDSGKKFIGPRKPSSNS